MEETERANETNIFPPIKCTVDIAYFWHFCAGHFSSTFFGGTYWGVFQFYTRDISHNLLHLMPDEQGAIKDLFYAEAPKIELTDIKHRTDLFLPGGDMLGFVCYIRCTTEAEFSIWIEKFIEKAAVAFGISCMTVSAAWNTSSPCGNWAWVWSSSRGVTIIPTEVAE